MHLEISTEKHLQPLIDQLENQPKLFTKAVQRAMRKTARWLKTRMARELAKQMGVVQKGLKSRFILSTEGKGKNQKFIFWLGTYPLAAEMAGKPRNTKKGVSVKKHRFVGAFYKQVYGSSQHVWIRSQRNTRYSLVRPSSSTPGNVPKRLSGRFPVERLGIEIDPIAVELFKRYERRVNSQFNRLLEKELNYVLNVE
ncbi:hypothetical protein KCM76_22735 [Zooshikella marina]|uniref:hypothetical protein n=1 Tax=Zooshikella ganghwensis TaxID=202772 RepID=UPI001BAF56C6|nr:hypothetical protein [Zooshikella ganghwensis]MBU2708828.1 hypothetical protein [Zooshikella ganghwensis]